MRINYAILTHKLRKQLKINMTVKYKQGGTSKNLTTRTLKCTEALVFNIRKFSSQGKILSRFVLIIKLSFSIIENLFTYHTTV